MTVTLVDLLLVALCAHRLTQLVVWDEISEGVVRQLSDCSTRLARLLACAHCAGFWCSVLATTVLLVWKRWGHWPLLLFLVAFATAGMVSIVEHATGWLGEGEEGEGEEGNIEV